NRVFIYEDNVLFLDHYRVALEGLGWEVETASIAAEASELLSGEKEFDVYVLDLLENGRHPRGLDLLRKLAPRQSRRIVSVGTETTDTHHADQASELGAWSFIKKHVDDKINLTCDRIMQKVQEAARVLEERRACRLAEDLWSGMTAPEFPRVPGLG